MKEEQNEFAYDNMDKGSNKSFQAEDDDEENKERVMNFNMDQLIQNPGRPSVGDNSNKSKKQRGSVK